MAEDDETPMHDVTVTCHTEGCGNADHPIPVSMAEGALVVCGACGQEITDVAGGGSDG
jgi:hypothetical protein